MESAERLFEKIIRVKVKLENAKIKHSRNCVIDLDPEGYAPCDCGASKFNAMINDILEELE